MPNAKSAVLPMTWPKPASVKSRTKSGRGRRRPRRGPVAEGLDEGRHDRREDQSEESQDEPVHPGLPAPPRKAVAGRGKGGAFEGRWCGAGVGHDRHGELRSARVGVRVWSGAGSAGGAASRPRPGHWSVGRSPSSRPFQRSVNGHVGLGDQLVGSDDHVVLADGVDDLLVGVPALGRLHAVPVGGQAALGRGRLALVREDEVEEQLGRVGVRGVRSDADATGQDDGAVLGEDGLEQAAAVLDDRVGGRRADVDARQVLTGDDLLDLGAELVSGRASGRSCSIESQSSGFPSMRL